MFPLSLIVLLQSRDPVITSHFGSSDVQCVIILQEDFMEAEYFHKGEYELKSSRCWLRLFCHLLPNRWLALKTSSF